MTTDDRMATQFETDRPRLRAVALRMLGSWAEADDALQEAWLRVSRTDTVAVERPAAWLTTVVGRVCLDVLRSRTARREESLDAEATNRVEAGSDAGDPERQAILGDSVSLALVMILQPLEPAERLAFVLHDMFGVPFDEIGPVVGRSAAAARQLASRARRRVQGAPAAGAPSRTRRHEVVEAFLAASKEGRFADLLAVLDPDAVVRADPAAAAMGAESVIRGAEAVARAYEGRAQAIAPALVDGLPGGVWRLRGEIKVVFVFDVALGVGPDDAGDVVRELVLVADPERIARADVSRVPGLTVLWWDDPED